MYLGDSVVLMMCSWCCLLLISVFIVLLGLRLCVWVKFLLMRVGRLLLLGGMLFRVVRFWLVLMLMRFMCWGWWWFRLMSWLMMGLGRLGSVMCMVVFMVVCMLVMLGILCRVVFSVCGVCFMLVNRLVK